MSRYSFFGQLDSQYETLGDSAFIGVNMRLDASKLPPGYVSNAVNMRFTRGVAETRLGATVPAWANRVVGTAILPWTTLHGVGVFKDPTTFNEYVVIAANGGVYVAQPHNTPRQMTLPAGIVIDSPVTFTQAFNVLIMHRGQDQVALVLSNVFADWETMPQTADSEIGLYPIPNATHSVFFQNRLFVPTEGDSIAISEIGDYSQYFASESQFRINQGSSDKLTAIYKFNDSTLIAFKERSVYAVNNVYGNLQAAQQDEITSQYGCVARRSIVHVGRDLWFLSMLGVMSLRQTELNELQAVTEPVSEPIQPLIDRINWRFVSNAVGAYWDNKYYLAVPLDEAEVLGRERAYGRATDMQGKLIIRNLVVGKKYRWVKNAGSYSLTCGLQSFLSSTDFVATATEASIQMANEDDSSLVFDRFCQVYSGVNNAVLVYDFLNKAWCGYDETPGRGIVDLYVATVLGRSRLMGVTTDGYHLLMENDLEEQLVEPVTHVSVTGLPAPGDTIRVNAADGGELVTATANPQNSGSTWGCINLAAAQQHIAQNFGRSYNQSVASPWSSPNAIPESYAQTGQVSFYSTNGNLPKVTVTGNWATLIEQASMPVQSRMTTRGYASASGLLLTQHYATLDLQAWNACFSINVDWEGVNESAAAVADCRPDRRLYYKTADDATFSVSNAAGDFLAPHRQDYSVLLSPVADNGGTSQVYVDVPADGVPVELHQETRSTYRLNGEGRAVKVSLSSTDGRIRVMAVNVIAEPKTHGAGTRS